MATSPKLSFALLIILLLLLSAIENGGTAAESCNASDITVQQSSTGRVVEGKPEYEVLVGNSCSSCSQSAVFLLCYRLSSVERLDLQAIRPVDDERCVVRNGQPIWKGKPIKFTYAWMTPQDFPVVSTNVNC